MAVLRDLSTKEEGREEVVIASQYVFDLRNRIEDTCRVAQAALEREGARQKIHFDKKAKMRTFRDGDKVLLLRSTKHNKLQMEWRGPYPILERVGDVDYRIQVAGKTKLFHANLLKLYLEREPVKDKRLVPLAVIDEAEEWEDVRTTKDDILLVTLELEETISDVNLDPENPQVHDRI